MYHAAIRGGGVRFRSPRRPTLSFCSARRRACAGLLRCSARTWSDHYNGSDMRIAPLRLLVAALGTVVTVGTFAPPQSERVPAFLISIPQNVNPALTQIHYFLTGPFGGYGGFVRTEADRFHYPIPTVQDGAPATVLKLIAYMPGCQITTMTDVLTASSRSRDIECAPLATVRLACRIEGNVAF